MDIEEPSPLRLGISSCLLGEAVRFDGGHKRDRFVTDVLGRHCEWTMVCPEFELGLGAPRESLRLVGDAAHPRLLAPGSGTDHTEAMLAFSRGRLEALRHAGLHGFVLKKDSPTCGLLRVKVWHAGGGGSERRGKGLWARALEDAFPLLPVEEEGRLHDPRLRENFIERVFSYRRLAEELPAAPRPRDLVRFHTCHKYTLLSHSPAHYRELGRLVADAGRRPAAALRAAYAATFMEALRRIATPRKHANVLQHLAGFLKRVLDADDRREVQEQIDAYRRELVPLIVPVTLLKHHFRRHPFEWVTHQTYLNPYPAELMLRNHV